MNVKEENVFLCALFSGLSGGVFDKVIAANTLDAIKKIADPEFVSLIGWRDSIVTFVRTHSKVTITMLTRIGVHPTYNQIKSFSKLKPQFNLARRHGKMRDPRDPGSRKFLNNCGNFFHELNKMVVFNINKTSFMLKMMK